MSNKKNNKVILSWDEFVKLGNPENAPTPQPEPPNKTYEKDPDLIIRILLEKKGRRGKTVSIIKGLPDEESYLKMLAKEIKTLCGVGGSTSGGEILIQGDHREKIRKILISKGFKNVKLAGG